MRINTEKKVRTRPNVAYIAAIAVLAFWCLSTMRMGRWMIAHTKIDNTPVDTKIDDSLVIIARYNDDVSWAPLYLGGRIPYEVCQKGDPVVNSSELLPGFYVSPNRGNEALCYLSAIVKHYHNLPDQMAFVHGHRDAWHEVDYALTLLSYQWEKRLPYASLSTMEWTIGRFPNGAQVCTNSTQCNNRKIGLQGQHTAFVWNNLLSDLLNMTTPGTIRTPCCAQFVVTKERILEHPLETYERLSEFLVETDMSDEWSGRVFEYLWHILFGMPAYYVDLPKCERWHCNANGERIVVPTYNTSML